MIVALMFQIPLKLYRAERFVPLIRLKEPDFFVPKQFSETDWQHLWHWCKGYVWGVLWAADAWSYKDSEPLPESLVPMFGLAHLLNPAVETHLHEIGIEAEAIQPQAIQETRLELAEKLPTLLPQLYRFWDSTFNERIAMEYPDEILNLPLIYSHEKKENIY